MTEQFRPHPENPKQNSPEAGEFSRDFPDRQPEQAQTQQDHSERHLLPNVWDILEREVRLYAPDLEDRPKRWSQEFSNEVRELNMLDKELDEKGTDRDRLILDLYQNVISQFTYGVGLSNKHLSLEEFQQFRSKVDSLSNEEICEEIRKEEERFERELDEVRRSRSRFPTPGRH